MGLLHCPICFALSFVSVFIGVSRSYMLFILFWDFIKAEYNFKLDFSLL